MKNNKRCNEKKSESMSFIEKHPLIRWIKYTLYDFSYYASLFYVFLSMALLACCLILVYIKLFPNESDNTIRSIVSGCVTIIIIPSFAFILKNKISQQETQFQNNAHFFEELSTVLLSIRENALLNKNNSKDLEKFIIDNKGKMTLYCPDSLNDNLDKLLKELNPNIKQDKKNILCYINTCIRCIRRISGKGMFSYVPNKFSQIPYKKTFEDKK